MPLLTAYTVPNNPQTWFFNFLSKAAFCPGSPPLPDPEINQTEFLNNAELNGINAKTCNPNEFNGNELYTPIVCALVRAVNNGKKPGVF